MLPPHEAKFALMEATPKEYVTMLQKNRDIVSEKFALGEYTDLTSGDGYQEVLQRKMIEFVVQGEWQSLEELLGEVEIQKLVCIKSCVFDEEIRFYYGEYSKKDNQCSTYRKTGLASTVKLRAILPSANMLQDADNYPPSMKVYSVKSICTPPVEGFNGQVDIEFNTGVHSIQEPSLIIRGTHTPALGWGSLGSPILVFPHQLMILMVCFYKGSFGSGFSIPMDIYLKILVKWNQIDAGGGGVAPSR